MLKNKKLHIVGGSGAMGTWPRNFLESQGLKVSVSDEKNPNSEKVQDADIIFISVPINAAASVIENIGKISKGSSLIVDLSSIKTAVEKALKNSNRVSIGMRMLFGPNVSSIQNQKIVVCKIKENTLTKELIKLLEDAGAEIIFMKVSDHDFQMAHIQGLVHFVNLSLAKVLLKNKIGLRGRVSTPVFLSQIATLSRVVSQSPELLSQIQTQNPEFLKVLDQLMDVQREMVSKIKDKNIDNEYLRISRNLESVSGKANTKKAISVDINLPKGLRIGYLGPEGTFSHQAVKKISKGNSLVSFKTIEEIFEGIESLKIDLGLVPAENTIHGTVRETFDLLGETNIKVVGSIDLEIHQNLLSKEKSIKDIKKIISHPQALAQSKDFIGEKLSNVKIEPSVSTIAGVTQISESGVGIIGSEIASKIYGLNILAKNIESSKNNITKFYIISKKEQNIIRPTRTILFLSVFNRVGILRDILDVFADSNINLNKIESRPSKEKNWDYYFIIEVQATSDDPKFEQALNILKQLCPVIKIMGEY